MQNKIVYIVISPVLFIITFQVCFHSYCCMESEIQKKKKKKPKGIYINTSPAWSIVVNWEFCSHYCCCVDNERKETKMIPMCISPLLSRVASCLLLSCCNMDIERFDMKQYHLLCTFVVQNCHFKVLFTFMVSWELWIRRDNIVPIFVSPFQRFVTHRLLQSVFMLLYALWKMRDTKQGDIHKHITCMVHCSQFWEFFLHYCC